MDRLFSVLDANKSGLLEGTEFITGMTTLFCGDFDSNAKFIFDFYDFDKDGKITKEDIRTVLSYITLSQEIKNYKDRVHSQEELFAIIEKCFKTTQGVSIDYERFKKIIEEVSSDIYLMILLFLYEKRPFNKAILVSYEKQKKTPGSPEKKESKSPTKLVASPTKTESFSPYLMFNRPKRRQATVTENVSSLNKKFLQVNLQQQPRNYPKRNSLVQSEDVVKLMPIGTEYNQKPKIPPAKLQKYLQQQTEPSSTQSQTQNSNQKQNQSEEGSSINQSPVPMNRKLKKNLKEIGKKSIRNSGKYNDVKIQPAFKQLKAIAENQNVIKETSETESVNSSNKEMEKKELNFESDNDKNIPEENSDEDEDEDEEENMITCQGYLYKLADNKLKKVWFKLVHKDLFYFKNDRDTLHKGMHNLSGVFIQEEKPRTLANKHFLCFSLVYPKKTRYYYIEKEPEYKVWIDCLKRATEYTNLTDLYEIGDKIGSGKFGLIKSGLNKKTGDKVAIKIMSKKDMTTSDLELVRTEIEILKICQHPNIIQLYEVFENIEYFYILMEYCSGGDLFEYLEKRGFHIQESRACDIMHKMCAAIYYIHSYGVAHRDLKPENVLMTTKDDNADIRILDFGLSKIIGPDEKCTEPYGTLSYVAPEVLLDEPYTKEVDLWSLGIITYLLLSGSLPFDHKTNEEEIARKTVMEPPPYRGSIWKKVSPEAKDFVDRLLIKDPKKRMTIKETLEHEWFHKFCGNDVTNARKKSKDIHSSTFELYSSVNYK